ncbi:MAG TPA: hypothetical protein VIC26_03975 [Marinagarivorans sp.]
MMGHPLTQLFNNRRKALPSALSMAGTGLNLTAQVPILCTLNAESFDDLQRVNICSSSAFPYFIVLAHLGRKLHHERLIGIDILTRQSHDTGVTRYLRGALASRFRNTSFFENQQLADIGQLLFHEPFLNRTLSSLPDNVCFWAYCTKKETLTKISAEEGFADMTFAQVIRACASVPKLHGSFPYKNRAFIDPLHSPKSKVFLQQLAIVQGNHLVLNTQKTEDTNSGTLYLQAQEGPDHTRGDYYRFMFNANNPRIEDTQQQALVILQQWPLVRHRKPARPKTQLTASA